MSIPTLLANALWEKIKHHSRDRLNEGSPAQLKQLQQEYRDALGLSQSSTFSDDAFNKLTESRVKDFSGLFKGVSDPTDATKKPTLTDEEALVKNKLNENNAHNPIIKTAIAAALNTTDNFTKAQKEYSESTAVFKKLIEKIPAEYRAGDIISVMTELKDDARAAIQAQHQLEKAQMTEKLASAEVTNALVASFKVPIAPDTPEAQKPAAETTANDAAIAAAEQAKKTIMADLEKQQKSQLETFDSATQKSLTQLHEAAAKELDRVLFLANLYKNNEEMRKKLDSLMPDAQGAEVEFGIDKDRAFLAGIKMEDIDIIQSVTGRSIHRTVEKDDKGKDVVSYTVQMPRNIFGAQYYLDPRQSPLKDMTTIAEAVKANGYPAIKMTVRFPDNPELSQKRGREAFEACIRAGYDLKDISINLNGELLKGNDIGNKLFKDDPKIASQYSTLIEQSRAIRKEREELKSTAKKDLSTKTSEGIAAVKETIKGLRPQPAPDADEEPQVNPGSP